MTRTGWLGIVLAALAFAGAAVRLVSISSSGEPALQCKDGEEVRMVTSDGTEIATCAPPTEGRPPPAGAQLTLGRTLDLNTATEADLTLLSGVGPSLARALVAERTRLGRFESWEQVDAVAGVGPSKLDLLQRHLRIDDVDGGGASLGL